MAVVSMNNLLEAGVHFGHQTKRWNPKIDEEKGRIIDCSDTNIDSFVNELIDM